MNRPYDPHDSRVFVLGTTVLDLRPERRTAPPTEVELIRDELRKTAEIKAGRRPSLLDRLRSGWWQSRPTTTRDLARSRS